MDKFGRLCALLQKSGVRFTLGEPLKNHTSFKIGGPAAVFCEPETTGQLKTALMAAKNLDVKTFVLGKGTNVLFADDGFDGMVVCPKDDFSKITVDGDCITAGCGAKLENVCIAARDAGLAGLEFAYGIPGGVGGAVYMNAGAYGGEMKHVLESVQYLDEEINTQTVALAEMELGYRQSVFQRYSWVILTASIRLSSGDAKEIAKKMDEHLESRSAKQPLDMPSAGSAFKRPPGAFAGALIDKCGLRGHRVGGAAISEKHCGFIVNLGGATCKDVLQLASDVAATVLAETGYTLEREIRVVEG